MINLRYPVNYIIITNEFKNNHQAIDLGWHRKYGGLNQNIYSPHDGVVISVVNGKKNNLVNKTDPGNFVKIKHNNELTTRLIHLLKDSIVVKEGSKVKTGDLIAKMGNSGYALGNHLHYNVYLNNKKVNPIKYTYAYKNQIISDKSKNKDQIFYYHEEESDFVYQVKNNDTLSKIGNLYNIPYQDLADYNNISNPNLIRVGQEIKIPKFILSSLLKEGSRGKYVKELQKRLNQLGYNLIIDGIFGIKTKKAILDLQTKNKLIIDGIVGKETSKYLGWIYQNK
ncbi:MAG: peptidoglycan DD-metalloendopeptidase family protein [Bacilli bacterium]|nr:peptidoglycan DD-metalloendopeptidase family protein [Bacilli bacterium]